MRQVAQHVDEYGRDGDSRRQFNPTASQLVAAVVELGSFDAATERLHVMASAVSRRAPDAGPDRQRIQHQ
jgi:hypothetical protein